MYVCIYETNFLVDFVLKMTEEEKKSITREKHPGRVAHGHKLAAPMKKRKEEILRKKEQFLVQPRKQSSVQSTVQSTVQPNYVYGVGILAVVVLYITLPSLKNS